MTIRIVSTARTHAPGKSVADRRAHLERDFDICDVRDAEALRWRFPQQRDRRYEGFVRYWR
jgi:hypothetical protein